MNYNSDYYNVKQYKTSNEVKWCPGCGDYVILSVIQKLFSELKINKSKTVFVSGIGCSSRFPYYMNTYGVHTIHGRAIPIATGIKLTNPELDVWVITGDGDCLSIGGNHLIHLLRRNLNINVIMFNNRIYGLTKGQYSPTSLKGKVTKSTPSGSIDNSLNVSSFILGNNSSFFARTTDTNGNHMSSVLKEAYFHKGTSFVEIFQNCVVFNNKEFSIYKDKELYLENNKKLLFNNDKKGIILDHNSLELSIVENNLENKEKILTHNQENLNLSSIYSNYEQNQNFPLFLGVFRRLLNKPTYEEDLYKIKAKSSFNNLTIDQIIEGKETWSI